MWSILQQRAEPGLAAKPGLNNGRNNPAGAFCSPTWPPATPRILTWTGDICDSSCHHPRALPVPQQRPQHVHDLSSSQLGFKTAPLGFKNAPGSNFSCGQCEGEEQKEILAPFQEGFGVPCGCFAIPGGIFCSSRGSKWLQDCTLSLILCSLSCVSWHGHKS